MQSRQVQQGHQYSWTQQMVLLVGKITQRLYSHLFGTATLQRQFKLVRQSSLSHDLASRISVEVSVRDAVEFLVEF